MSIKTNLNLICRKCKGRKYIGDEYYAMGAWYVDVTCLQCAHSVDIEVNKLKEMLKKLENDGR